MFGSPLNFDAGPYESSLRFWAKRMAKTTQKRGYKVFAKQVGDRIFEYHCMGKARRDMGLMGVDDGLPKVTQPPDQTVGPIQVRPTDFEKNMEGVKPRSNGSSSEWKRVTSLTKGPALSTRTRKSETLLR